MSFNAVAGGGEFVLTLFLPRYMRLEITDSARQSQRDGNLTTTADSTNSHFNGVWISFQITDFCYNFYTTRRKSFYLNFRKM